MKPLRRRAFTLIELLIAVIVIGILTTAAIVSYEAAYERARIVECEANLAILQLAVQDAAVSGSLSELSPDVLRQAYAQWRARQPWWSRALARLTAWGASVAEAASGGVGGPVERGYVVYLKCPNDRTYDPDNGQVSYAINPAVLTNGKVDPRKYLDFPAGGDLVYDADHPNATPGNAVSRHREHGRAVVLKAPKKGKPKRDPKTASRKLPNGGQGQGHGGGPGDGGGNRPE